jgi:hypothetical protein
MDEEQVLYSLKIHERFVEHQDDYTIIVTRVPNGWVYTFVFLDDNQKKEYPRGDHSSSVFVPMSV